MKVGDTIYVDMMTDPYTDYTGQTGVITSIDSMGQVHTTLGGCALCEEYGDVFHVVKEAD